MIYVLRALMETDNMQGTNNVSRERKILRKNQKEMLEIINTIDSINNKFLRWGSSPSQKSSPMKSNECLRKKLHEFSITLSEKKAEGILPNLFYDIITKDTARKENHRSMSLMNIGAEILNIMLAI